MAWRHKITRLREAKKWISEHPDCCLEISHGSRAGYHVMVGAKVLCRISKASFNALNDGLAIEQSPFINVSRYKIKNEGKQTMI